MTLSLASTHRLRIRRKVEVAPKAGDDEYTSQLVTVVVSVAAQLAPVSGSVSAMPAGLKASASWWTNLPAGTPVELNDVIDVVDRLDGAPGPDVGDQFKVVWIVAGRARPSGAGFWDAEVFLERDRATYASA